MAADPSGINATITNNIFTNNSGKITASVLASVLLAMTAWCVASFAPLNSPAFTGSPFYSYSGLNYYVATAGNGGSDANPCTQAAPCLTISHAVSVAVGHDVAGQFVYVNIGAGTFQGSYISGALRGQSGTNISNAYLVLSGAGSGQTTINDTLHGYAVEASGATVVVQNAKIQAPQGGDGLFSQNGAVLQIGADIVIAGGADAGHASSDVLHTEGNGIVEVASGKSFSITGVFNYLNTGGGGGGYFELDPGSGIITCSACDINTSVSSMNGGSQALIGTGWSFSGFGAITGKSYTLSGNSVITNYAGVVFPGSTGVVSTGGRISPSPVVVTVAGTGLGSGYACVPQAATVRSGIITCTAGSAPAASGTLTVTMPELLYSNADFTKIDGCTAGLVNGSGSWGTTSNANPANISGTTLVISWVDGNNFVAQNLTNGSTYSFSYTCGG